MERTLHASLSSKCKSRKFVHNGDTATRERSLSEMYCTQETLCEQCSPSCIISHDVSSLRCLSTVRAMREPAKEVSDRVQDLTSLFVANQPNYSRQIRRSHRQLSKMMDIIENNPYRCLGVFSNSPTRERVANQGKIKAFLKVGKEVTFPLDLPHVLPTIARTVENVSEAESKLTLLIDQVKYAQFWWLKVTPLDEVAFNHLQAGNLPMAQSIWEKKETVSSLQNRIVLALIQSDYATTVRHAETLYTRYATEFLHLVVGQTTPCTTEEMGHVFLDTLLDAGVASAKLQSYISLKEWSTYVGEKTISPLIDKISQAIADAKASKGKGSKARYNAGVKLDKDTKALLSQLQKLLPATDLRYQTIADKLGLEILQCGIDYYNDSEEIDAARKAMVLQERATNVVVGSLAKGRCKENVEILNKIIADLPPAEVMPECKKIADILDKYVNGSMINGRRLKTIIHGVESAKKLLNDTKQLLLAIKGKLGATNSLYLSLSTKIVDIALNDLIGEVNRIQSSMGGLQYKLMTKEPVDSEINELESILRVMDSMLSFDLRSDFRQNRLNESRQKLVDIINQLKEYNRKLSENKSASEGCYIATMAYGDYNHPQVMLLRGFRDNYLAQRNWGRKFIKTYYKYSPKLVETLKNHATINRIIRILLDCFIEHIKGKCI